MWKCAHCDETFEYSSTSQKANHSRWCSHNPKRNDTQALADAQRRYISKQLGDMKTYTVACHACAKDFSIREREKQYPLKEKYFCSRSCSNHRGSGLDWASRRNIEITKYTTICFGHHEKQCVVCDERNIVSVHHLDENHQNNDPANLIPMCPTHHQYWHSKFRPLVEEKVRNYIEIWKKKWSER